MQESYRQALGGIYPVPVLRLCRKTQTGKIIGKTCAKCQKITNFFFVKALYAIRESVILGMDQRRKPQEKEGTKTDEI